MTNWSSPENTYMYIKCTTLWAYKAQTGQQIAHNDDKDLQAHWYIKEIKWQTTADGTFYE